jgi:hypothetical protein
MQVDGDGEITTQDLPSFTTDLPSSRHSRAKPENLRQFRAILDELRPSADRSADDVCAQAKRLDGSTDLLDDPKPDDIEVRWLEIGKSVKLTSCWSNNQIRATVSNAWFALLGISAREEPGKGSD